MSRIGKKPICLPDKVEVKIHENTIAVKGPLGEESLEFDENIVIQLMGNNVELSIPEGVDGLRAKHGLYRALVANMVLGVSKGFTKELELVGIGYRVQKAGNNLKLSLGYSHGIDIDAPQGIDFEVQGNNKIIIKGSNKKNVGDIAAKIRKLRPPEPYKGKGIKYVDEYIARKAGKSVK